MTQRPPHPALDAFGSSGVIAVLRAPTPEGALSAIDALVEAGITGIEVTFTTPDAPQVIQESLARHGGRALVGAGTVLTADQALSAADAGAQFLVSPGTEADLARVMIGTGALTLTGALTPSEVMLAVSLGVDVIKIFPGSLGGPGYLKSLRAPFPNEHFMPTGGVSADNLGVWFASGALAVGAGGELVPATAFLEGGMQEITSRAKQFVDALDSWHQRKVQ
jgi:2-dehydro-3-deoxyphosphogluconate aldolase/(4S)-4-hydroxy-2-oxoglutarate aldolase